MEHFDNSELQGAAAARAMCGGTDPYDPIPFFWSNQYELDLQYYGHSEAWDQVIVRGDPVGASFLAFYLKGGTIESTLAVNRSRDVSILKRLLGRSSISVAALRDDRAALKTLLQA